MMKTFHNYCRNREQKGMGRELKVFVRNCVISNDCPGHPICAQAKHLMIYFPWYFTNYFHDNNTHLLK